MARYVAFLGGINVGGHRVSMADLKREIESLGFDDVSTFIASGNVLFSTGKRSLEPVIERHLGSVLGYAVPTWVRTGDQVVALADPDASPFGEVAGTVGIGFLKSAPTAAVRTAVEAMATPSDTLRVLGTELWWHLPRGFSGSELGAKALERAGLPPMTTRNLNTIRKLAAKLR